MFHTQKINKHRIQKFLFITQIEHCLIILILQNKAYIPILVIQYVYMLTVKCLNKVMRVDKAHTGDENIKTHKVDLNDLIKKVKEEEKKSKMNYIAISAAAVSAVAVFGIILTL